MFIEEVKGVLRSNGYKLTPQRRVVLEVMLKNKKSHMSAEELYDKVRKELPDIGLATVYRTLQLLYRLNILSRISFDDSVSRYEIKHNMDDHQHHHLICKKCGKIEEVHVYMLEELEKYINKEFKFKIIDHSLNFEGECKQCR
ncbi:MAG: Fur family transcriptional regulator [Bacillota bacterium]|nr:Fur family transcriptional regulator [Bacillota bacterium]